MDDRSPEVRFHPDRRFTILAGLGVVVAGCLAVVTDNAAGRLLAVAAAAVSAIYALCDLVFVPRVVASGAGVVINSPMLRRRLAWSDIEEIRADTRYRLGLRSTTLEIDAGDTLAVLSRRAIGADPADAARLIGVFRPPQ